VPVATTGINTGTVVLLTDDGSTTEYLKIEESVLVDAVEVLTS
jgi:hypothetical protein